MGGVPSRHGRPRQVREAQIIHALYKVNTAYQSRKQLPPLCHIGKHPWPTIMAASEPAKRVLLLAVDDSEVLCDERR